MGEGREVAVTFVNGWVLCSACIVCCTICEYEDKQLDLRDICVLYREGSNRIWPSQTLRPPMHARHKSFATIYQPHKHKKIVG